MGTTYASNWIAAIALMVALLALASANLALIKELVFSQKLSIEIGESAFPQERFCTPSFPVSLTMRHISGSEVSLKKFLLTIKRPDGKLQVHQASTYQTLTGEQPFLSGLRLKPNDTWANSIIFSQKFDGNYVKERNELLYQIEDSKVQVVIRNQAVSRKNSPYPVSSNFPMPFPAPYSRMALPTDPNAPDMDWSLSFPVLVDVETKKLVTSFCEKNLREFQKGKYLFNFEILAAEGAIVASKTFEVTVYESDIERIRKLNDIKYVTSEVLINKPLKEFYTATPLIFSAQQTER